MRPVAPHAGMHRATALAGAALVIAGGGAPTGAAPVPVPVNPAATPVVVALRVPAAQSVTVRVTRVSDGLTIATLGPVNAMAGPVTLSWPGGRGPGGTGEPVPDGAYRLEGLSADGVTVLPATPPEVQVDATPPRPVIDAPAPTVPASTRRSLPLRPGGATEVRAVVRWPGDDAPLVTGAWRPAGEVLAFPRALAAKGVVGTVAMVAEGRDAAGNLGTSDPVVWSLQPPGSGTMVVRRVRTGKPLVSVTVDDGYGPGEAARMIDAARATGTTITFCFNAIYQRAWSASLREAMRQAVRDGHLDICSHGYAHKTSEGTSRAAGIADLSGNRPWDQLVGVATGPFYRPPYGAYGPGLLAAAGATGYRYVVLWDVDTDDWRGPGASVITQRAVGGARRGSIILMHTKPNSAAAMPGILRGLKAKGLQPVGLGELFSAGRPG